MDKIIRKGATKFRCLCCSWLGEMPKISARMCPECEEPIYPLCEHENCREIIGAWLAPSGVGLCHKHLDGK